MSINNSCKLEFRSWFTNFCRHFLCSIQIWNGKEKINIHLLYSFFFIGWTHASVDITREFIFCLNNLERHIFRETVPLSLISPLLSLINSQKKTLLKKEKTNIAKATFI
jgi:hypothetical protein